MKTGQTEKKTLRLKVAEDFNYRLIGISSHENDYRLVWAINNQLKMKFVRIGNLAMHNKKHSADLEFSRFFYEDEDRYLKYYLFSNRCPEGILFPEIRNMDFIIQIIGELTEGDFNLIIKELKSITILSALFVLQPNKIKSIGQLFHE
ncbi:MAG: IPExxxVDY family protein [Bacteroidales bacterium]|nr:IPExxxVDY family protein [Bacteroidales bacterium]